MSTVGQDVRYALADADSKPGFRDDSHHHAGPRHRRGDDDLHRGERRAAAAAAIPIARSVSRTSGWTSGSAHNPCPRCRQVTSGTTSSAASRSRFWPPAPAGRWSEPPARCREMASRRSASKSRRSRRTSSRCSAWIRSTDATSPRKKKRSGGPKVVILSYSLWRRRYGAYPGIVGRRIRLDGLDQTVVGVMPPGSGCGCRRRRFRSPTRRSGSRCNSTTRRSRRAI